MFSIVYGFLVSSVINLFGREITKEMKSREGSAGNSLLGDFRKSITRFILRGVVFLTIVFLYAFLNDYFGSVLTDEHVLFMKNALNGYFISQIIFILVSMHYYFVELFRMLFDETVLLRSRRK